jgi:Flp pilus assembly protein TadB
LYHPDGYAETLLRSLIRAQLGVTLSVLVPAAAVIAVYPLLAVLFPQVASATVGVIPLAVVILGFGIYPPLVVLGFVYVRRARRMEQAFVELLRQK